MKQSKSKNRFSEDDDSGLDSDDGNPSAKNRNSRVKAVTLKEEPNNGHNSNNNNDDDDDDDDEVQIIMPQRGRGLAPVKSAPSKAATSATTSSSSSSSSSARSGSKSIQKVNGANSSNPSASRTNVSDDEVENDDDVDDNWSGRHQSREVRACRCF